MKNTDKQAIMSELRQGNDWGKKVEGATVKHVPWVFKTKAVKQYIFDLIIDYKRNHPRDLLQDEREMITALLIESLSPFDEHESLVNCDDLDVVMAALKCALKDGCQESHLVLAEKTKAAVVKYYKDIIDELFWDVLGEFNSERNEWLDYVAKHGDEDQAYEMFREGL